MSPALVVIIDTTPPAPPPAPDLAAATDTGASSTDDLTMNTQPTFTAPPGTGTPGETVTLLSNGVAVGTAILSVMLAGRSAVGGRG